MWRADAHPFSHLQTRSKCNGTPPHEQISLLTRRPVGWSKRRTKIRDSTGYYQAKTKISKMTNSNRACAGRQGAKTCQLPQVSRPFGGVKGLTHSLLRRRARDIRNAFWGHNDGSNIVTKRFALTWY